MFEIVITCHNCLHSNRMDLGMPGFELKSYQFTTFSEAHQHMIEHPDHYMMFEIVKNEEQ